MKYLIKTSVFGLIYSHQHFYVQIFHTNFHFRSSVNDGLGLLLPSLSLPRLRNLKKKHLCIIVIGFPQYPYLWHKPTHSEVH